MVQSNNEIMGLMPAFESTSQILRARDAMVALFGDRYPEKRKPWVEMIRAEMKNHTVGALEAVLIISRALEIQEGEINGMKLAILLSAAADIVEGKV